MNLEVELKEMQVKLGEHYDVQRLQLLEFGNPFYNCKVMAQYFSKKLEDPKFYVFGNFFGAKDYFEVDKRTGKKVTYMEYKIMDIKHNVYYTKLLSPLPFPEVEWGAHFVVSSNGMIPEPALGKFIPLENYSQEMFGEDVPYEKLKYL